jgi:hypothetical protein
VKVAAVEDRLDQLAVGETGVGELVRVEQARRLPETVGDAARRLRVVGVSVDPSCHP